MRLPYLQVTQETFARAKMLAAALGVDRSRGLSIILDLWAWAVDLGRPDSPPEGVCSGELAEVMLSGAVEWPGDHRKLVDALEAVGLVERLERGVRVRGMDRYRRTWEKNHRKLKPDVPETGASGAVKVPENGAKPAPQTQTQTQTHKKETPPAREKPPGAFREAVDALFAQERGGAKFDWTSLNEVAVGALLGKADGDESEILRRFRAGLRRTAFPRVNDLVELAERWNACAAEQAQGPPPSTAFRGTELGRGEF